MTQTLTVTTTINAPVAKVRDTMLNHPTYELWTKAFSEHSSYTWSRDAWAEIRFVDGSGHGMIAKIAENRVYEYVSIHHLGEIGENNTVTFYDSAESFENYMFTQVDEQTTKLDVEMTWLPDEWVPMFQDMRPKALQLLKELCEK